MTAVRRRISTPLARGSAAGRPRSREPEVGWSSVPRRPDHRGLAGAVRAEEPEHLAARTLNETSVKASRRPESLRQVR
jgi:hypothetical protein